MQPEPSILTCEPLSSAGALILGDGTAPGVVIVSRSLLRQICGQMDGSVGVAPAEQMGLLLGPEAQSDDLLIEEAIPLRSEYRFSHSLDTLGIGIESVQPKLAEARRERSQTILGLYRVLTRSYDTGSERDLQFLASSGKEHVPLSAIRCRFEFVALSASETTLRVLLRKGQQWEQLQEVTLQSEVSSPTSVPEIPAPSLKAAQSPLPEETPPIAEAFQRRDWLWVNVTLVTLLLLSLAANTVMVSFVKRTPRETVNLQPLTYQIGELSAAVSKLQPTATTPAPSEASLTISEPPTSPEPATSSEPATSALAPKPISGPPPVASGLVIAKKPTMLGPSEVFQFKVQGDPVPEVVWSSEGPGSIDRFYGLYKAPNIFSGESKVKVTATSWMGSQSVTFTLKGAPR